MKRQTLLCVTALALSLGLSACSQLNESDPPRVAPPGGSGGNPGDNPVSKPVDPRANETNYKICGTGTSARTDISGLWEMTESQGDLFFRITLQFTSGTTTLRQECFDKTRRLTAEVTVPSTFISGTLNVQGAADDVDSVSDSKGTFDCKVSLIKNVSTYKFNGNCLELTNFQTRPRLVFIPR